MQQLPSNIYSSVQVYVRGSDDPIVLNPENGTNLMSYLIKPDIGTFVQLTDKSGDVVVVRTNTIESVKPVKNIEKWYTDAEQKMRDKLL